jgi:aspartate aminotransferase
MTMIAGSEETMREARLSALARGLAPSPTIAVEERTRRLREAGERVLSLGGGQPDFDTPEPIKEAAIAAIRAGETKYTAVGGTQALRRAIAAKLARDQGLEFAPEAIVAANGSKHALYNALLVTIDAGDEVLIPAPYWVSYPEMVRLAGGRPVVVATEEADGFRLDAERLHAAVTPRTRALILNSPSNPTGAVLARPDLEAIAEVVRRHDLLVITDEIYEKLVYDGTAAVSFAQVAPDRRSSTIVVSGVSKTYAMTGWRIGYAAAPVAVAEAMTALQGQSTSNPSSISQAAAIAALELDDAVLAPMLAEYARRRAIVMRDVLRIPGFRLATPPAGTFYAFPHAGALIAACGLRSSDELAGRLLDEAKVAVVAGSGFGADRYLRLSFATSAPVLEEALGRLAAFADAALPR